MTLRNQVLIWVAFLGVLILLLWLFRGILLPFVVGAALAYLLNPMVNQLQKWRFSRGWATAVVLLSVITIVVSLFYMFVPLIGQQKAEGLATTELEQSIAATLRAKVDRVLSSTIVRDRSVTTAPRCTTTR